MFLLNIINKTRGKKEDLLSGLTVSLALIPEAVAFSFIAGVDPVVGLYAAFFIGLITSLLGGRPGMISGATGAMAVVMTGFVAQHGVEYLFAAVVLTGVLQLLVGVLKLGELVRFLPHPVMLGFVNGLAIVIGLAQFGQFNINHRIEFDQKANDFIVASDFPSLFSQEFIVMAILIGLTLAIIYLFPKLTRAFPSTLMAIIVLTLLVQFVPFFQETKLVKDIVNDNRILAVEKETKREIFNRKKDDVKLKNIVPLAEKIAQSEIKSTVEAKGLQADFPSFSIPSVPFNWETLKIIFPLALILAAIGLIESLMTLSLIDEITETRGNTNRECFGQGTANVVTGFFGGMGGCAMIGQSMININSGGRSRLSGVSAAVFLLLFILFTPKLIELIPIATLIGVMFSVVIATFEWSSLKLVGKVPRSDIMLVVIVSVITVFFDLAVAVGLGIVLAALVFSWRSAKSLSLNVLREGSKNKLVEVHGYLFFSSVNDFKELFIPSRDPEDVYLDFKNSRVCDYSGLEALHSLSQKYKALNKRLHLVNLSRECAMLLDKAGDIVDLKRVQDKDYSDIHHRIVADAEQLESMKKA